MKGRLSSANLAKLEAAAKLIAARIDEGVPPADILAELVRDHGAVWRSRWDGHYLRIAGVASSCTYSKDAGLLSNWHLNATVRLVQANLA